MWFPVFAGAFSVVLGALLALLPGASTRHLGPFQSFALLSSVAVVLGQLLPDALSAAGLPALLVFGAAFGTPRALEWLRDRILTRAGGEERPCADGNEPGPCSDLGLELGYGAFLLHSAADGVGLSVFGGNGIEAHYDVVLAIAAHTIPVTAMVIMAFEVRNGVRSALWRSLLVLLSTLTGMALPAALSPEFLHGVEPWLAAAAGGLLLHVVSHGWAPDGPPTLVGHVMDFAALVAAGALFMFGGGEHHHGHGDGAEHDLGEFRHEMVEALLDLGLTAAPMLLLGLMIAALLQAQGSRLNPHFAAQGSRARQAMRGALMGLPLPVCACGILPVAHSLRARGALPAFVVAFVLSTPELGIDTFVLTSRFLGVPFAIVRLVSAVLIAALSAYLLSLWAEESDDDPAPAACAAAPVVHHRAHGGFLKETLHHFEDLLYHVGAWTLVGLLGAAYFQAVVPDDALHSIRGSGLDLLLVGLLSIPSYVCASSATPLAAVLLHKGLSTGAVLVGLLLGPAINLGTLAFLRRSYGLRATMVGAGSILLGAFGLSLLVNRFLPAPFAPVIAPAHEHSTHDTHGPLAYFAAGLLIVLVMRAVWRSGLRTWLSTLGEVLVQDDAMSGGRHDHGHHDHGHHHPGHHHPGHPHHH